MTDILQKQKDLLVALLPRKSSLEILQSEKWYHIPVEHAPDKRWPPKILAFYQGKVFGEDGYKIRYFGEVSHIDVVPRKELFPDDKENAHKADKLYHRLKLISLEKCQTPIISHRPRRIVFIPTTSQKFFAARQINDLFDESPLEDTLWEALKKRHILAERQWKVIIQKHNYYLDFAVFCKHGKLAIETDGYTTHFNSKNQIDYHTWRQNDLEMDDWRFLHYTSRQINDSATRYLDQIEHKVGQLGGLQDAHDFFWKTDKSPSAYIVDGEEPF